MTVTVARVLVQNSRNEVLVLRRSTDDSYEPGRLDFPGGGVETSEDFAEAAARELREETGLLVEKKDLRLLYAGTEFDQQRTRTIHRLLFACMLDAEKIVLSPEHDEFSWIHVNEISKVFPHHFYVPAILFAVEHGLILQ